MSFELVGVRLVAENGDAYLATMTAADKATTGFGDTSSGVFKQMPGLADIAVGALHKIGEIAVSAFLDAGKAAVGFFKDSISAAGDFQQNFAEFGNAVGHTIDGTGLKLDDFKKEFISLGKELPVSTADVEKAAIEMARGGIDPAVIAGEGLRRTIQFASAAMKGDLVGAAQISAKTMQAWTNITDDAKTKTDFLSHAQDLLTQSTTAASTTVDQLFLGLSNVGGTARLAGVSFDETVKSLAQLTPSFASSADAGTSFKTFLARLQPSTTPAIGAMEKLGLWTEEAGSKFYDAKGKFIGMAAAEKLLHDATQGLTDAQKQQALQQIFGNDAIRAAAVFAQQGADGYNALSDSIAKQTTLTDAAKNNQSTYNTALENFHGSIEALQITIGSYFLPVLTDLFNNYLAPGINVLTGLAGAVFGDQDAFANLSPVLQGIVTWVSSLMSGGQGVGDIWANTLLPAIQAAGAYFEQSILPILQDIGAIALPLLSAAVQVAGGLWTDVLVPAIKFAWDAFNTLVLPIIKDVTGWLAKNLPPAIQATADFFTTTLLPAVHDVYTFLDANVIPIFRSVVAWLEKNIPPAVQTAADFWNNTLWPALQKVWAFIQGNVIPIIQSVVNTIFPQLNTATSGVASFWNTTLWPALQKVWSFIDTYIIPVFKAVANVLDAVLGAAVKEYVNQLNTQVLPGMKAVYNFAHDNLIPDLTAQKAGFKVIADFISDHFGPTLTQLRDDVLKSTVEWFDNITEGVKAVVHWLNELADKIRNLPGLPDAYTGNSPPPMANWMNSIAGGTANAAMSMSMLRGSVQGMPASPMALLSGGASNSATYNQQRTVNLNYQTQYAPPVNHSLAMATALAG
jgi:TP901 family phage tail tape measure protein